MNRKKHMKKSTFIKIIGIFYIVVSLFVFGIIELMMGLIYPKDINLERDYIQTEARVLSTSYSSTTGESYSLSVGDGNCTVYEYFDEDKVKHEVERNFSSASIKQGDVISIYYKKTNSDESIPEILAVPPKYLTLAITFSVFLTLVPGIIILVIGFIVESRDKKRRAGIA